MANRRCVIDPLVPWEGPFPYRALERFGVTPQSTATAVLDVSYEMTAEESADPALNDAWETLRLSKERLLVDFFCHELPPPAGPGHLPGEAAPPLPWDLLKTLRESLPDLPTPEAGVGRPVALPPLLTKRSAWWELGLPPDPEGGKHT